MDIFKKQLRKVNNKVLSNGMTDRCIEIEGHFCIGCNMCIEIVEQKMEEEYLAYA